MPVLVIEPNQKLSTTMCAALMPDDYDFKIVPNIFDAFKLVENGWKPTSVIIDIARSAVMDGLLVARTFNRIFPAIEIIFLVTALDLIEAPTTIASARDLGSKVVVLPTKFPAVVNNSVAVSPVLN